MFTLSRSELSIVIYFLK